MPWTRGLTDAEFAVQRDSGLLLRRCPGRHRDPVLSQQCCRCWRRIDRRFDFEIVPGERRTSGTTSAGSGVLPSPDPAEVATAGGNPAGRRDGSRPSYESTTERSTRPGPTPEIVPAGSVASASEPELSGRYDHPIPAGALSAAGQGGAAAPSEPAAGAPT